MRFPQRAQVSALLFPFCSSLDWAKIKPVGGILSLNYENDLWGTSDRHKKGVGRRIRALSLPFIKTGWWGCWLCCSEVGTAVPVCLPANSFIMFVTAVFLGAGTLISRCGNPVEELVFLSHQPLLCGQSFDASSPEPLRVSLRLRSSVIRKLLIQSLWRNGGFSIGPTSKALNPKKFTRGEG